MTSLSLRLGAGAAALILMALAGTGLALVILFERHVERRIAAELSVDMAQLLAGLTLRDEALAIDVPPADPRFSTPLSGFYWQAASEDGPPLRSRSLWDQTLPLAPVERSGARLSRIELGAASLVALSREVVLAGPDGAVPVRATVAIGRREIDEAVSDFALDLAPALAILAVVLFVSSVLQIRIGLRPLARIRGAVVEIANGTRRRLGGSGPKEVVPLAAAIDALLGDRETTIEKAKSRAADLAHGLKTPLQALSGIAGRLRQSEPKATSEIELVASTLLARVERALALSRAESRALARARADVAKVAAEIIQVVSRTPAGATQDLTLEGSAEAAIDPADLAELLGTLVENAVRFARSAVGIRIGIQNGRVRIVVVDDGPGIPPAAREAALARGGRLDETGPGDGLGLAIAAEIAAAYGGSLTLEDSGPGLRAVVSLPLPGASAAL